MADFCIMAERWERIMGTDAFQLVLVIEVGIIALAYLISLFRAGPRP